MIVFINHFSKWFTCKLVISIEHNKIKFYSLHFCIESDDFNGGQLVNMKFNNQLTFFQPSAQEF